MSCPSSLYALLEEPRYSQLKAWFIELRQDFKSNPQAAIELEAYNRRDNEHTYSVLKGLVPSKFIGDLTFGGGKAYNRSDTFFTDYLEHHDQSFVLSSSGSSLIIGNSSSYDVRQYSSLCYQDGVEKSASAGMSFLHLLVIPRTKVYNVVSLEDAEVTKEMISHFKTFWASPESVDKSIQAIRRSIDTRTKTILKQLDSSSSQGEQVKEMLAEVERSFPALASKLASLSIDQFVFAFHPHPHASIGHLHMHVLAAPEEFRQFSTGVHDWKSIPARAVLEVLDEEKSEDAVGS